MSEPSAEALVAGGAAASAVEELHAREAVDSAASEALESSAVAGMVAAESSAIAMESQEVSHSALEMASLSGEAANEAAAVAEEARQEAQSAGSIASESVSESQALRDEMASIRQLIEERFPAREAAAENAVTEVEVSGNAGSANSGQSGKPAGAGSSEAAPQQETRRKLRRRSR